LPVEAHVTTESGTARDRSRQEGLARIELAGWKPIYERETRRRLAAVLANDAELAPAYWWDPQDVQHPFDPEAFATAACGEVMMGVGSGPPLHLRAGFSMSQIPWLQLQASVLAVEQVGFDRWLALADQLAAAFEPDFGRVRVLLFRVPGVSDPILEERCNLDGSFPPIVAYATRGPQWFGASTYLGPRLLAFARDEVSTWTGPVHAIGDAIRRIDLAPQPLDVDDRTWLEGRARLERHFGRLRAAEREALDWGGRARRDTWDGPLLDPAEAAQDAAPASETTIAELERLARERRPAIRLRVEETETESADLTGLVASHVSFEYAQLPRARFDDAALEACMLGGASLPEASFARASVTHCDLGGIDATAADFRAARLHAVDLRSADAPRASFDGATLTEVRFDKATMSGASFHGATLIDVHFPAADLRGVDLRGARCKGGSLAGADLRGARLEGLILEDVQLDGAKLDSVRS
jgi:uncharacterized protein YjbI with pentapeptide repeats